MAIPITIPKLGQTVEEVVLGPRLVPDGSRVTKGQEVLSIETDKAAFSVEAPTDGYIHFGPFQEGDVVPVHTVVALVGAQDEVFAPTPAEATSAPTETPAPEPAAPAAVATAAAAPTRVFASPRARRLAARKQVALTAVTGTGPGGRIIERDVLAYLARRPRATPVAQRLAAEAGLDLSRVTGTGPGGFITRRDVAQALPPTPVAPTPTVPAVPPAAETPPPAPAALPPEVSRRVPLKGVRGIIAQRMAASVHTTARVTLVMEVDATELVALRERLKTRVAAEWGFAPGYNDLLAKIVAASLRRFPYMNARLTEDAIEWLEPINLGMAVDTERGLLVPVIRNADRKSLREFGQEFRALVERARQGKALPDDLTGGTFTITNLGPYEVDAFTPVINLPEAAILGVGRIAPKPVVRDGQIVVRQMLTLSLVFDHRLVDGAPAARFLQDIKNLIEEPYLLLAL
ncbi:MAG: dihydrolipoamide acetyltransferase family protein [Anaerolineae bacterium]|nr:2-oxo acid dehydrogenase subunit E2 [Caldilineales bacterium]MDW8268234.1 dihydrolipoamide acetyltransferase family protein [Anaerolineae bacterium]